MWRLGRRCPDPFVAVVLTAWTAGVLAYEDQTGNVPGSICVLGFSVLIALRRWRPIPVAIASGVLMAIPYFAHDASTVYANDTFVSVWAALFLYAYTLGSDAPLPGSLVGIAAILVGINLSDGGWNPVPEMLAVGPFAGGLAVASRRRASAELEQRARELEEEREIFVNQSVRYERSRIARELHDIVAHSVSLMVVQANAGERLASRDQKRAAEAFSSISEAAQQAEAEIDRLVELLHDPSPSLRTAGLRIVEELVERARASGLAISCHLRCDLDDVNADAAFRVVQEGITNALKHAPGAPIAVAIDDDDDEWVELRLSNGPAGFVPSGLEKAGGGHGLAGMHERMSQCGGTFTAGAIDDGGWQLVARFPRRSAAAPARDMRQ